jgi:hypothetical protein
MGLQNHGRRRRRRRQEVGEVMWDEWGKLCGRQKLVECVKIKGWKLTCLLENAAWSSLQLENNRIMVIDIVTINTENITGKDETEKN